MKFLIYTDYKANEGPVCGYSYEPIEAKDILEAIEIADRKFSNRVYLMQIMQKVGKIEKDEIVRIETYKAVLCRRSFGWHRNTKENSETEHIVEKNWIFKT